MSKTLILKYMTIQKFSDWKLLLSELEVVLECSTGLSTLNEQQLERFELQTQLILPQEYKEFCQIIGTGRFGRNMFYIECPDPENYQEQLESNEIILDACKSGFSWSDDIRKLLDSSYLFGGGDSHLLFVFDLRTYIEENYSYKIYGISCITGFCHYFGRSFFEFINFFCIGDKAFSIHGLKLKLAFAYNRNDLSDKRNTFIPFPLSEEDFVAFEEV